MYISVYITKTISIMLVWKNKFFLFLSISLFFYLSIYVATHTHTHTHIYIYIYIWHWYQNYFCKNGRIYIYIYNLNFLNYVRIYVFFQGLHHSQGVTQGQFLRRVKLVWIHSINLPKLVASLRLKNPVYLLLIAWG